MSHISPSKLRRVEGPAGQGALKATEYENLWILSEWIPFFRQKAVFWNPGMRIENSFNSNYKRTPIIDMSGGGTDQLSVPLNTVDIR